MIRRGYCRCFERRCPLKTSLLVCGSKAQDKLELRVKVGTAACLQTQDAWTSRDSWTVLGFGCALGSLISYHPLCPRETEKLLFNGCQLIPSSANSLPPHGGGHRHPPWELLLGQTLLPLVCHGLRPRPPSSAALTVSPGQPSPPQGLGHPINGRSAELRFSSCEARKCLWRCVELTFGFGRLRHDSGRAVSCAAARQ